MKNKKLKITALLASSVLAIQATNLLTSSLSAKAMPLKIHTLNNGSGNQRNLRKLCSSSGFVTGALVGVTVLSATGLGLSISNIIHNSSKDNNKDKDKDKNPIKENNSHQTQSGIIF